MSNATRRVDADLDMKGNTILNALVDGYYTKDQVDDLLEGGLQIGFKPVDSLPAVGESKYIYLVPAGNKKRKNLKDEYIWLEEPDNEGNQWELIGSTEFKLDIVQNEDGIIINDEVLQSATEYNDGLMTRDFIAELRGKQDQLTAGPGIKIENNEITAIGGGAGGGHATNIKTITSANKAEGGYYVVNHNLGSYDILFQIRTTVAPIEHVQARVVSPDMNTFWIYLSKDLEEGETLSISMLACDVSAPSPEPEETVQVTAFSEASETWEFTNTSKKPVYVQTYDETGNEIRADVTESSADEYSSVVANFIGEYMGSMLTSEADIVVPFTGVSGEVPINVTEHGFSIGDWFLVQVYIDGPGELVPDIVQNAGTGLVTVDIGDSILSGTIALFKATQMHPIDNETEKTIQHGLGRKVGVQVYLEGSGQTIPDVVCVDDDTVVVSANPAITGHVLIL